MKNKLLFGLLISAFTSLFLSNVRADIKQDILVNLYTQLLAHPQEKIYLQCDRSCYINGENIYFRAYNINPSTRKPSELSRYVYVELISPFNEVVLRQQIRPDDERLFHGVLEIPTELPEGDYKLRGYTRFMENIDVEHFYSKTIYIADPNSIKKNIESQVINENNKETLLKIKTTGLSEGLSDDMKINISLAGNNKKKNSDKDDSGWSSFKIDNKYLNENRYVLAEFKDGNRTFSKYIRIGSEKNFPDIYFYPEGGEIVYGKDNKIAFKALMPNGEPAELTGNIFDADNNLIIAFNTIHEGMGSFILNNAGDKKYYAEYNYNGSLIKKDLPDVNRSALSLKLDSDKDHVNISVNSADNNTDNKYYLLILRHGVPMLIEEWDFENNNLTLGNDKFLPGVSHIVLINENMNIMSERLYFNNKTESVSMELLTDKNSYKQRSRVLLDINIDEVVTDTVYTSFAISVIDDNDIMIDTTTNIVAEILLTSELKGNINNPAQYFSDDKKYVQYGDLLMLTHGWRNYFTESALAGNFIKPAIMPEISQSFSGRLLNRRGKSLKNGKVKMIAAGWKFSDVVEADENGKYIFNMFEFPDSTLYQFISYSDEGKDDVEVLVDQIAYPEAGKNMIFNENKGFYAQNNHSNYVNKADLKYIQEKGMRFVDLDEVIIKGKSAGKRRIDNRIGMNYQPDRFVSPDELKQEPPISFEDLFYKLPGISCTDSGPKYGTRNVLISVEGRSYSYSDLCAYFSPYDFGQIELFNNPALSSMFGSEGESIVVALTLWPPGESIYKDDEKTNRKNVMPLGYQKPVKFYSPEYETPESKRSTIQDLRTTIYWKPDNITYDNKQKVTFYTADSNTSYSVVIEGITNNNNLIYQRKEGLIKVE